MSRLSTSEEYLEAVTRLGEMVYSREPGAALQEYYENLCGDEKDADTFPAFAALRETFGLEPPEAMCVAAWLYHDSSPVPPLSAGELLEHCRRIGGRSPGSVLGRLFVISEGQAVLHPVAADFLLGREPRLPEGAEFYFSKNDGELLHARELYKELIRFLKLYIGDKEDAGAFPLLIVLSGEKGCGRKFLLSRLAEGIGCPMLRADLSKIYELDDIILAAEVYGAVVCMENALKAEQIAGIMRRARLAFAVCGEGELQREGADYLVLRREMPPLSAETRRNILSAMLAGVSLSPDIDLMKEIGRRRLNTVQMRALAGRLRAESIAAGGCVGRDAFVKILKELAGERFICAVSEESAVRLNEIVLPDEQLGQLYELCAFIGKWEVVYKNWGFGEKFGWGRGISALFYGAPGTGKTMAAAAVASETGLPLARVDVSQLMSKYIGETQKNIGKVFDEASKNGVILFFDEADALFAKRSEASDAQDKYANAETAYLLQRLERHDGVCILATNLMQNFDEAFRRRIGYMLHFPMPDEAMRKKIWNGIFPGKAPIEGVDFGFLARHLEFSGAAIKNCAVHAAYLAAAKGTAVTMRYILDGAKNEYQKQGKALSQQVAQLLSV